MATMAPALTDAPAEAHHMRFSLAPPSSALSPSGVESSGSTGGPMKEEPLVTSYLCSDVTSVPSAKDSLQIQGVLIKQSVLKTRGILPSYLNSKDFLCRKNQDTPTQMPVNGLAKKLGTVASERGHVPLMNGGRQDSTLRSLTNVDSAHHEDSSSAEQPLPVNVARNLVNGLEPMAPPPGTADRTPECTAGMMDRCQTLALGGERGVGHDGLAPPPLASLDLELSRRSLQSCGRQREIEGRLRGLRRRLQVVQAKQAERHMRQQLGGLLHAVSGFAHADIFLRSASVPAELERLSHGGAGILHSLENAFDSDATESSSGGDTDVEEEELERGDGVRRHISLWRRAEGRYAVDRAAIISHWNWLQAQVSDLEYRIRQQTDVYRQLRATKGSIVLEESISCDACMQDVEKAEPESNSFTLVQVPDRPDALHVAHSPRWKACASDKPVNGTVNSIQPLTANSSSPEGLGSEQLLSTKLRPPAAPLDLSCVAARTRPLLSCKKRRLVRSASLLNHKLQRSGRCIVNNICMICRSSISPIADFQYERPLLERLSHFDPCIHPILSFPDDVCMNLHLQRVMKTHWQNRPLEKTKASKKIVPKQRTPAGLRLPAPSFFPKDRRKMTSLLSDTVRLSHYKTRPERLYRQRADGEVRVPKHEARPFCRAVRAQAFPHGAYERSHGRKRPREHSSDRADAASRLFMDSGSPCAGLAGQHTPTHSPLMRPFCTSLETSTFFSISQSAASTPPVRRRRGESSFDINNIVIPMSVAATTRVEKLQYKEILTPSWRVVDVSSRPITEEDENVEVEDLSDAAFAQLHLPCEEQERSRWTWTASAAAKRRGSRCYKSLDGRSTPLLGGAKPSTPRPSSPDTGHFHALQDYGSVASPCSPASPELLPAARDLLRFQPADDLRCPTPDLEEQQPVHPWERRTFPLEKEPEEEAADRGDVTDEQASQSVHQEATCGPDHPPSPSQQDDAKMKGPAHPRLGPL